jgi:hypothetical protein
MKVLKATMLQTLMRAEGECSSSLVKTSFSDRHAEQVSYGDFFKVNKKRRLKSIKNKFGYSHVVQKMVFKELTGIISERDKQLSKEDLGQGNFATTYSSRQINR